MNKTFNMNRPVVHVSKGSWFHLRNICKICPCLDTYATENLNLVYAFVFSQLNSNSNLLYGITEDKTDKLQRVQNPASHHFFQAIVGQQASLVFQLQYIIVYGCMCGMSVILLRSLIVIAETVRSRTKIIYGLKVLIVENT